METVSAWTRDWASVNASAVTAVATLASPATNVPSMRPCNVRSSTASGQRKILSMHSRRSRRWSSSALSRTEGNASPGRCDCPKGDSPISIATCAVESAPCMASTLVCTESGISAPEGEARAGPRVKSTRMRSGCKRSSQQFPDGGSDSSKSGSRAPPSTAPARALGEIRACKPFRSRTRRRPQSQRH